jgi:Raf kinase inhibitor-like YbhB/YbcL family protein
MSITLRSRAFQAGKRIPDRYTCEAENISPPLEWGPIPEGTESFVLVCDDPDAPRGVFSHWILYDIPKHTTEMPSAIAKQERPDTMGTHGRNDFGSTYYQGPCPPPGSTHRYYYRLYAIDTVLHMPPGASRSQILKAIDGHILDQAELMGKYSR